MRLRTRTAAAAGLGAIAVWAMWAQNAPAGPVIEIQMTAKNYEFNPDTIHVHAGDQVKLVITALDHAHGIKIDALHIKNKLEKGEPVTLEFMAVQPGTYPSNARISAGSGTAR